MEATYINKIKKFINDHLKEDFSLNQLAASAGYSPFHMAREFKESEGLTIMEYTRERRILAAAKEIGKDRLIYDVAVDFRFETHAGFTKAFYAVMGCGPQEYQEHAKKMKTKERGFAVMDNSKIVIRHVCEDDVQDLWENVYSAMTPRQIKEDKILYFKDLYKKREGLELAAEVDGKVVMTLPVTKPAWIPLGFVWDNNYTRTGGDEDVIMQKLLEEMKKQAKILGIFTLISPQGRNSEPSRAMQSLGFTKVMESGDWEYLMMAL